MFYFRILFWSDPVRPVRNPLRRIKNLNVGFSLIALHRHVCCFWVYGAPVPIGYPEMIGINDIQSPDHGDAVEIKPDEVSVFWACGLTPRNALTRAALPFAITHSPGFMFVSNMMKTDFQTWK